MRSEKFLFRLWAFDVCETSEAFSFGFFYGAAPGRGRRDFPVRSHADVMHRRAGVNGMSVFHGIFAGASNAFGFVAKKAIPAPEKLHFRELRAERHPALAFAKPLRISFHQAAILERADIAVSAHFHLSHLPLLASHESQSAGRAEGSRDP